MKLKKVVAFAMAAVMTLGMVACGSSSRKYEQLIKG